MSETDTKDVEDFQDEPENDELYSVKHPLQNTWTLWYYESDRQKTWEENQRKIISFSTVEDFWSVYNHVKTASELRHGTDYSVFKNNIRPMWEDSANKQGGRWVISLDKKQRGPDLDHYWLELLLFMIGESLDNHCDEICGAVVNIRNKGDKIALWTADCSRKQTVLDIGVKLKERLQIPSNFSIEFQAHKDTSSKSGPSNMYTL